MYDYHGTCAWTWDWNRPEKGAQYGFPICGNSDSNAYKYSNLDRWTRVLMRPFLNSSWCKVRTDRNLRPTSSIAHPLSDMNILADTSIGAFAFSNGDRRLIFQDVSGVLRQGFWSPDTKAWMVESDTVVATNAKNYTPISVVDVPTINANGTAYSVSISGGVSNHFKYVILSSILILTQPAFNSLCH